MYTFMRNTQYLAPKWRAYVTPYEAGFAFSNGVVVGSLWDLKCALLTLEESLIIPHCVIDDHHIAKWVEVSIGDVPLATLLATTNQRWGMVVALERHMMRALSLPSYVAKRWLKKTSSPFRFVHGVEIASLTELQTAIHSIADDALSFHYTRFPNDLSLWLSGTIGDYYLSDSLLEASHKDQIETIIDDHLTMLMEAQSD
jgi:hypothetical protein